MLCCYAVTSHLLQVSYKSKNYAAQKHTKTDGKRYF